MTDVLKAIIFFVGLFAVLTSPWLHRYLFIPLRLWWRVWYEFEPRFFPFEAGDLPKEILGVFNLAAVQLAVAEMRAVAHLRAITPSGSTQFYVSVWTNSAGADTAILTFKLNSRTGSVSRVVSIGRDFVDESSISVSTLPYGGMGPQHPGVEVIRLPRASDLVELYRVQRAWADRDQGTRVPQVVTGAGAADYLQKQHAARLDLLRRCGWLKLEERTGRASYTLKGAFLMMWQLQPPAKKRIQRRQEARADYLLHSLGFHGIEGFLSTQRALTNERNPGPPPTFSEPIPALPTSSTNPV